jgi:hypothetical protein
MSTVGGGVNIVTDGLVLYLDAANTKSYPGSGTTWTDVSRGGNNGTLTNGPTFNSANGGSIVFDGTNDFVNFGNILSNLSNITYEIWFNTTASSAYDALIEKDRSPWMSAGLQLREGKVAWVVGNFSGPPYSTDVTSSLSYNDGNWHQAVGTYNRNTTNLFVDGVLQATTSSTAAIIYSTAAFKIGFHSEPFSYFNGRISKASVYNRALTPQEVLQNYNATKTRFGL